MPLYGRLGEALGKRRLLLLGMLCYLGGTVTLIAAQPLWIVFTGRVLQGIGSAGVNPLGDGHHHRTRTDRQARHRTRHLELNWAVFGDDRTGVGRRLDRRFRLALAVLPRGSDRRTLSGLGSLARSGPNGIAIETHRSQTPNRQVSCNQTPCSQTFRRYCDRSTGSVYAFSAWVLRCSCSTPQADLSQASRRFRISRFR